jgi:hypothetical protein
MVVVESCVGSGRHYNQCTQATTFTVHNYHITIAAFQVTHKDTGHSLKMAYECRNMYESE